MLFLLENHSIAITFVEKNINKRKYTENYLQYGFISIIIAGNRKPKCAICCNVLSVKYIKANKLKCHFDRKSLRFSSTDYFRSKAEEVKQARQHWWKFLQKKCSSH